MRCHPYRRNLMRKQLQHTARPAPCSNCIGFGWEPSVYAGRRPCSMCQPVPELPEPVPHERVQRALAALLRNRNGGAL